MVERLAEKKPVSRELWEPKHNCIELAPALDKTLEREAFRFLPTRPYTLASYMQSQGLYALAESGRLPQRLVCIHQYQVNRMFTCCYIEH